MMSPLDWAIVGAVALVVFGILSVVSVFVDDAVEGRLRKDRWWEQDETKKREHSRR
jgi:hypothetical protein